MSLASSIRIQRENEKYIYIIQKYLLGARTLLGAAGIATRSKKLLGAKGIATRSKDAYAVEDGSPKESMVASGLTRLNTLSAQGQLSAIPLASNRSHRFSHS